MTELRSLDELPIKALERLVELLDYESRRTCRSVSKTLKRYVDQTGLSVTIDTRRPESTRFSQNVRVTEAVITHLETLDWKKKYLESWKTVILTGFINGGWFTNGLQRNCTNLRVLIIHEKCIVSQDFPKSTKPLPIFDHLTQIQIFLKKSNFMNSIAKDPKFIPALLGVKGKRTTKVWKKIDTRIHNNMIYLLQTIRSRVLKVLHVNAFTVDPYDSKKPKICWEHDPLFEFIQSHESTLEEVHIPNLLLDEPEFEEQVYKFPSKLQTLVLTMKTVLTFWKKFLLHQTSLQNLGLHVGLESCPVTIFYLILVKSVLTSNARTLVCLRLNFSNSVHLDMKIFQVCQSLEFLAVEALVDVDILNLNQLQLKSLNTLELVRNLKIASDFDGIQFLKNCHRPKYLRFMGLAEDSPFTDPKYMLKFVKLALRCRTLNTVSMVIKKELGRTRTCQILDPAGLVEFLEKPTVQCYESVNIWDVRNLAKEVKSRIIRHEGDYDVADASVNVNYLETTMGLWMHPSREQPLNFPRNAESYTIFEN